MTKVIAQYYDEELQFWIKVLKPIKDSHRPHIHSKMTHRMKGFERKAKYEPQTEEASLHQQALEFLRRKEG